MYQREWEKDGWIERENDRGRFIDNERERMAEREREDENREI
jgi:hypothetical protein